MGEMILSYMQNRTDQSLGTKFLGQSSSGRATERALMERLGPVIAELEAARITATAQFASEANMPVQAFLRHFQVIAETGDVAKGEISFRVEPRES